MIVSVRSEVRVPHILSAAAALARFPNWSIVHNIGLATILNQANPLKAKSKIGVGRLFWRPQN
jgi:hypothetical protein